MKNIAICYSEHAIKVSDSYCSGASHHTTNTSSSLSAPPSIQTAVASIYKVKLSNETQFLIRISWCTPNPAFSITISDHPFSAPKLSRNFKIPRRQRGSESLQSCGLTADVLWDLRRARFGPGPEPVSGFYMAVLVNSELALTLGDMEHELEEVTKLSGPKKFSLISRGERLSGGGVYAARGRFSEGGAWHDIVIRLRGGMLSVEVDGKSVIEVKRLQWNFRGNQSIFLDGLMIDLMWDVHDWMLKPSSGCAVFLFRTRTGSDSRLWLEDTHFHLAFSFLVFASKNPD
ncbi:hypothetical protein SASPL_108620 [Salvia splendens]|uniref:Uncharacterized protein n=1 Tax=Salvia splendens TaxID=180675 RepID=A0A8X8YIG0_SALSN|nr:uncharacterized protein LOC121796755 [Salvia splendens]KAG6430550.1 hypothetical protein SASPL_108620 [Salvia splendens]